MCRLVFEAKRNFWVVVRTWLTYLSECWGFRKENKKPRFWFVLIGTTAQLLPQYPAQGSIFVLLRVFCQNY